MRGKSLNGATVIVVRAGRLAFAAFDIAAMVQAIADTTGSLVNFFSFFTIESNVMAIAALMALLALGVAAAGRWRAARRSGDQSPRPPVPAPGR